MKQIKEILIASVSLFLLGFGICMAVSTFFMYREGEQEYETLREYVKEEERKENESEVQAPTPANKTTVDFQALKKINSDIIAWIRIPDTKIDYPVVQGKDNAYYLKHTFQKTEHAAGSIFLDMDNEADFSNRKSILYGHNMKDGSMFGCLDKYLDRDYFEKYNEVFLFTPEEKRTYHIIAAYEHPAEHILTSYDFSTTEGINDYLRQIPDFVADSGGVIQDETEITPPLLTLSTCTRNDKQKRCLVQGILVECEKKNQEE